MGGGEEGVGVSEWDRRGGRMGGAERKWVGEIEREREREREREERERERERETDRQTDRQTDRDRDR